MKTKLKYNKLSNSFFSVKIINNKSNPRVHATCMRFFKRLWVSFCYKGVSSIVYRFKSIVRLDGSSHNDHSYISELTLKNTTPCGESPPLSFLNSEHVTCYMLESLPTQ